MEEFPPQLLNSFLLDSNTPFDRADQQNLRRLLRLEVHGYQLHLEDPQNPLHLDRLVRPSLELLPPGMDHLVHQPHPYSPAHLWIPKTKAYTP